jgi:hypothetical protein
MIDYLKTYTGKGVTCNECGFYTDDINILIGLKQMAIDEGFEEIVFYSGMPPEPALPISQMEISEVI